MKLHLPRLRAGSALLTLVVAIAAAARSGDLASAPPTVPEPPAPPDPARTVIIDDAHHNYHTLQTGYAEFAGLVSQLGHHVIGAGQPFSAESLARGRVLVIVNALHASNVQNWSLPTPSAVTRVEIEAVRQWVHGGGGLLLIADHPITLGRNASERIDSIAAFTGQAFQGDTATMPFLLFGAGARSIVPATAWVWGPHTPVISVAGWAQGAVRPYGAGRVVFLGEAALFTSQICGADQAPMGWNAPRAAQNRQFASNLVRWLMHEY